MILRTPDYLNAEPLTGESDVFSRSVIAGDRHDSFGGRNGVGQQHGNGHRADAARHRRDPRAVLETSSKRSGVVSRVLRRGLVESPHDLALVDEEGQLVAKRRIPESAAGFAELVEILAATGDDPADPMPVPVAVENPARAAGGRTAVDDSAGVSDTPNGGVPIS